MPIEDLLTAFFSNNPGCKLQLGIESLAVHQSPVLRSKDGVNRHGPNRNRTDGTQSKEFEPMVNQYTAVHVKKTAGKWLTASVRGARRGKRPAATPRASSRNLNGWSANGFMKETMRSFVFSCHPIPVDNGTFLVRKFAVHVAGRRNDDRYPANRVGDAQSGKFRAWVFDFGPVAFSEGCLAPLMGMTGS